MWGRPLRSIFAVFNKKKLSLKFEHLVSTDNVIVEQDLNTISKKITNFKDYISFLKINKIILDQGEREKIILKKINSSAKSKDYKEIINPQLLEEVVNIVEDPNVLLGNFNKEYLKIPEEIIISTLEKHQRYFPIFDIRGRLTNNFFLVANKKDEKKLITEGNKRVVEARLADAKFFWDRDRSKNLIKQIANLKTIMFYEKLGTIYDKTQRLRKLAALLSDELNINKEKIQIAASISKSDLCSDLVNEYPELQGVMGKYFALAQGFEEEVADSISDHYLPTGITSPVSKKKISYSISIVDKLDTLTGFFLINEKPTSSKDPFALRRAAIGLLRTIIENNLTIEMQSDASNIITLTYTSINQDFAKEFVEKLIAQMSKMYISHQTARANTTLDFLQDRADSVFLELEITEQEFAKVKDINQRIVKASGRLKELQLMRRVEVLNAMYLEIIKNLELSKITLLNKTPIINIIDEPVLPLEENKLSKLFAALFGGFLGFLLSCCYLILSKLFSDALEGS